MSKKTSLPHYGQILTTKKTILQFIEDINGLICDGILYCVATGLEDINYKTRLYSVCSKLWFLSKLVYKNSHNIIVKLSCKQYKQRLFDSYMETPDEISSCLHRLGLNQADVDYTYRCMQSIELLWCQMIGCRTEQVFLSELAYAADYIITRKGNVESPVFDNCSLFPLNYHDFNYTQGIAEEISMFDHL